MFLNNQLSKLTILIGLSIIASASFTRQLVVLTEAYVGEKGFLILLAICFLSLGLFSIISIVIAKPTFKKVFLFIAVLVIGMVFSWHLEPAEVKVHTFEYAFLGWLAMKDLIRRNKKGKGAILALTFGILVSTLDEVFQLFLPFRVCDTKDILLNSLGVLWGIVLYLLYKIK
ncbi:MAG: VanZ family protein [Candidatus Omnitrophota bacterium]|nr:VanZ family protein [Candidatus Omnitrophota bacterium]